jgi:hypothetical protein
MVNFVQQGSGKGVSFRYQAFVPDPIAALQLSIATGRPGPSWARSARRNRAWEARELFDLVDDVEGELAEPVGLEPFGHA